LVQDSIKSAASFQDTN